MKFLWKRKTEFTFIRLCWMFTQVCFEILICFIMMGIMMAIDCDSHRWNHSAINGDGVGDDDGDDGVV